MSPEVCRGEPATAAHDVWSFGITFAQLITGTLPFADEVGPGPFGVFRLIFLVGHDDDAGQPRFDPAAFAGDTRARDFCSGCVHRCMARRLNVDALLAHPFLVA